MELDLTEEQAFFVDTTRRFLEAECGIAAVRDLADDPTGYDPKVWARGAELGWTSLLVSEADGGGSFSDHGLADLVLVAEEMGRVVAPGPLGPVNVVAGALTRAGSAEQKAAVLPGLLSGERVAAWCGATPVGGRPDGGGFVLSGTCSPVEAGAQADHLLVAVEHDGGPQSGPRPRRRRRPHGDRAVRPRPRPPLRRGALRRRRRARRRGRRHRLATPPSTSSTPCRSPARCSAPRAPGPWTRSSP